MHSFFLLDDDLLFEDSSFHQPPHVLPPLSAFHDTSYAFDSFPFDPLAVYRYDSANNLTSSLSVVSLRCFISLYHPPFGISRFRRPELVRYIANMCVLDARSLGELAFYVPSSIPSPSP
jgi:hypothetical protein